MKKRLAKKIIKSHPYYHYPSRFSPYWVCMWFRRAHKTESRLVKAIRKTAGSFPVLEDVSDECCPYCELQYHPVCWGKGCEKAYGRYAERRCSTLAQAFAAMLRERIKEEKS